MKTVLDSLNAALNQAMTEDERVYLIGEDLLDPYGGAFKVSRGLSTKYPERVLSSPISEAAITGLAGGMALRGLRPVVEIMFGDFTTLIADQLINSIAKFRWMYNDQVSVPLVIRSPMGGRRGYGPTHSQSIEKLFLGVPGLRTLAPTNLDDPGELLLQAISQDEGPVFFVENKLQYLQKLFDPAAAPDFQLQRYTLPYTYAPLYSLSIQGAPPPSLTLVTYGYMSELVRETMLRLAYENEIFCELLVPTQLSPFGEDDNLPTPLLDSLRRTGHLLTIEEGTLTLGWGAEVLARASQALGTSLKTAQRVAAAETPIPASIAQEEASLPQVEDIIQAARKMV
ncbi:MAG: hypothetical protein JXB38_19250 [Anaerolineales bacterium]|nr:hypothetical protein [Anaerolineales bacterium]